MLNRIKESLLNKTNVKLVKRMKQLNFDKKNAPYTPLQHAVSSTEDIDAEGQDQDSDIEYDSHESVENDVTSTVSYDELQLASEVLFLIGRRSSFRRTIRLNGRFIQ